MQYIVDCDIVNVLMLIEKITNIKKIKITRTLLILLIAFITGFASFAHFTIVRASTIQDQINALREQNNQYKNALDKLRNEATSYQDAIKKIQAQIDALQGQIDANTAEQERLTREISAAEEELAKQKRVLGENIKVMYLEGQITTLEMLATSKDLSEFVDKEQYRNTVKDKIKATLEKVTQLKHDLTAKRESVEELLKIQREQQSQLAGARSEQNNLLAYNVSQQAEFNAKTKDNQAKIENLVAQQRRANFSPDGGYYFLRFPGNVNPINPANYPYRNAGFGMSPGPGCVDGDGPDKWGYCTRQCVSYTAWAVEASGRNAPYYYGNAKDWVAAAYARGIPVFRSPEPGDVAISTAGYWGHAMYVESVSGSTFTTSEYNANLTGQLSYQTRSY